MSAPKLMTLSLPDEPSPLPARRVLDCVFALTPAGRILHYHLPQLTAQEAPDAVHYALSAPEAAPERARCRVIPPLVPEFRR